MRKIQINCNTNGKINIDDDAKKNEINIALVDRKQHPVARYKFDSAALLSIPYLTYKSTGVRVHFYDGEKEIIPTMKSELTNEKCG